MKFGLKRSRYNRLELITMIYSEILDHSLSAENVHKPACNHFSLKMATIKSESLTFYIMQFQLVASFYSVKLCDVSDVKVFNLM